ncbi:MAG: MFS transporter [Haloferacaceae archaeon]
MGVLDTDRRVLVLAMARMADALGNSFLVIVLPGYIASGEIDVTGLVGGRLLGAKLTLPLLIGIVLSLFGLLNSLGQPFTGRVSDRTGRRRAFILVGLAVFGVASAAYPFVTAYGAVVAVRAFQGVGAAFTIPATVALVNEYSAVDTERGGNFGVFNTLRLAGFGFGPIVAGLVIDGGPYATPLGSLSGFDAAFGVAVLGAAVSFALVWLFIRDPERTRRAASEDIAFRVRARAGDGLDPVFVLGVGTFLMAIGIALFATLQETINARLGQGPFLFSVQFAAVVLANVVFQVPVGRASDRFGRRRFIVAGFALLMPALVVQGYVTTPLAMVAARLVQGIAVAMVFAPSLALAGDLAGSGASGSKLSVLTMAFGLGIAVGPTAAGYLVRFGFAVPFLFAAGLGAVAFVLVYTQVSDTIEPSPASSPTSPD